MSAQMPGDNHATRVRLYFRAKNLLDADTFSKSDPYIVLHDVTALPAGANLSTQSRRPQGHLLGRTETIWNDLNPVWKNSVEMEFRFEARQTVAFVIYDDDGKGTAGDDVLASAAFELAHVVAGRGGALTIPLQPKGELTIVAQEVASGSSLDYVTLQFSGSQLREMNVCGESDPYFKLYKLLPNGERQLLHQSHAVSNTVNPNWAVCPALRVSELVAGNDWQRPCLQLECWNANSVFKDNKMGQFTASLQDLIDAAAAHQRGGQTQYLTLVHATKAKEYGHIVVRRADVTHYPTFTELLAAGMQINVAVAVDFTASNGNPSTPQSLHHMNPRNLNQYQKAIASVCDVVLEYDSDKLVPAFGFGAELPNDRRTSHCFHLNAQADPHVQGLEGLVEAYAQAVTRVTFFSPTNFAPTIIQATRAARDSAGTYTILLILTDGCITDTDDTLDAIVEAGDAPLSIIIVGVGSADFSIMNMLDGDDERIKNRKGVPALRDLVQFVPFRDFVEAPRAALAAEVLQEVPTQVMEWAMINHVKPEHFASNVAEAACRAA